MRNAETVLGIIHDRGNRGLPLGDVYRQLFNPTLYLLAYGRIYKNAGAMTPGATTETVDGMSMAKIEAIIDALRHERYRWTPVRRVYIEKKGSKKKRRLGIPTWSDKLLQEVMRLILEAYYEPQFSPASHGFRPRRGCHTALDKIDRTWQGTKWFIEGDIAQCFDSLDHRILVSILGEKIQDNRFLRLLENLLRAGYLENWRYHATLSGSPQGSGLSPVLANIYLDRLDRFVETTLLPKHNCGKQRRLNPAWSRLQGRAIRRHRKGNKTEARKLRREMQKLPCLDPMDPTFRRLRYLRYADDWLLGFSGPRCEAEAIKQEIGRFLRDKLALELSGTKTLITHARSKAARFLGYDIVVHNNNRKLTRQGHRCLNGKIGLKVPKDVVRAKCRYYWKRGAPSPRPEMFFDSAFNIVTRYQQEYRGIVAYYRRAYNLHQLGYLKWVMQRSLTLTLAEKLNIRLPKVYQRYRATLQTDQGPRAGLQVVLERDGGRRPLVANWGGISLARDRRAILNDRPRIIHWTQTDLEQRLRANTCELCGSSDNIEVHHVRALKDLDRPGRAKRPNWVKFMVARQRKTLVTCRACHNDIYAGRPVRRALAATRNDTGEPSTSKGVRSVRRGAVRKVPKTATR